MTSSRELSRILDVRLPGDPPLTNPFPGKVTLSVDEVRRHFCYQPGEEPHRLFCDEGVWTKVRFKGKRATYYKWRQNEG